MFLDVGGNRGQDPIRLYNKVCRTHSLEPNPILTGRLRLEALLGARTTLSGHEPALRVEGGEPKMFAYLRELGYESYSFANGQLVPGARPGCNALHLTAKHFAEVSRYGREDAVPP